MSRTWSQSGFLEAGRTIRLRGPLVPVVILLAIVLAVPVLLLGLAALLVVGCVQVGRALLAKSRQPNGMLDGRRNVRVIVRD